MNIQHKADQWLYACRTTWWLIYQISTGTSERKKSCHKTIARVQHTTKEPSTNSLLHLWWNYFSADSAKWTTAKASQNWLKSYVSRHRMDQRKNLKRQTLLLCYAMENPSIWRDRRAKVGVWVSKQNALKPLEGLRSLVGELQAIFFNDVNIPFLTTFALHCQRKEASHLATLKIQKALRNPFSHESNEPCRSHSCRSCYRFPTRSLSRY